MDESGVPSLGPRNGPPVVLMATAARADGMRPGGQYGASLLVRDGASLLPPAVSFGVETMAGPHEIWVENAAYESRPMALRLDGALLRPDALSATTGGWTEAEADWHHQATATLAAGPHTLTLDAQGDTPHLRRLALVPVSAAVAPLPDPASPARGLPGPRGLEQDDAWFDFVGAILPALHRMLALRADPGAVAGFLGELAEACARDVADPQERIGYGGPFNGQRRRQRHFARLDQLLRFDAFVETGAFLGTTTAMLAELGRPVFSCEIDPAFHRRALARLSRFPDVRLFQADSRAFLRHLADTLPPGIGRPFCYLDAHWGEDLPLADEIAIIAARFAEFVIFCDDFRHPFRDYDYGYDSYGPGKALDLEDLKPRLARADELVFLFPIAPPALETGRQRGTLVIMPRRMYEERIRGRPVAAAFTDPF